MVIHLLVSLLLVLSSSFSANALVIPSSGRSICTHNRHRSLSLHKHQNHHITSTLSLPRGGASKLFSTSSDNNNDDINDEEVKQQKKKLTREFFSIALPAFIQLAAEPLAGLVDTAYLGRLGPEVLGKLLFCLVYIFAIRVHISLSSRVQNILGGAGKSLLCLMYVSYLQFEFTYLSRTRVYTKHNRSCN